MSAVAEATLWYVYGVVPSSHAAGVEPDIVEHRGLAALVAPVPASDYAQEVLPERLNDPGWLESRARAHQDVLEQVATAAPVVPFRFATIYRGLADVREMLRAREAELDAALARVAGRVELGVKAWAARDFVRAAGAPSLPAAEATGRGYLEQRLGARDRALQESARLAEAAADAHERLLEVAVEGIANRPQPRELTGRDDVMILNGAYLVDDLEPLRLRVERLEAQYADQGVTFEITGPWPPYNFASLGGAA